MNKITRNKPLPLSEDLKERMISRILCYNKHLKRADFINKTKEMLLQWIPPLDRAYFKDELAQLKRRTV